MSENWAVRQRNTNKLARILSEYVFTFPEVTANQVYGLSKLSWITNSYDGENPAYVRSTKIPALEAIFDENFSNMSLSEIEEEILERTKNNNIRNLVTSHTGFTNFYKAYRNSVLFWVVDNLSTLLPMYQSALSSSNNTDRLNLINKISSLGGIPKANHPEQLMRPEYFLTPSFFMLDPNIKFPLINGNKGVKALLSSLKVSDTTLGEQFKAMVGLYGKGGIQDAADLDQIGHDLPDFLDTEEKSATKKMLKANNNQSDEELPFKEESDIKVLRQAATVTQRRIHNTLTNKLIHSLSDYTLLEGRNNDFMFDVLVKEFDGESDLLIEVKSSIEQAHIRMAIGQLHDYWHKLKGESEHYLAILLPIQPSKKQFEFLAWMDVGVMWFEKDGLHIGTEWLECLSISS